jgi:serine/threonine-protein kinase
MPCAYRFAPNAEDTKPLADFLQPKLAISMMNETNLRQLLAENNLELVQANVGEGGSAYVHQARVREPNAQFPTQGAGIAVKEYKAAILKNPGQVLRIRQEPHISKLVSHPSLVKTYGLVVEPAEGESGPYLLAMDWLSDSTLEKWIADPKSPKDWPTLRDVMIAIVDAVVVLHEKKIYHRDLKPENVAMGADGKPVVMDSALLSDSTITNSRCIPKPMFS